MAGGAPSAFQAAGWLQAWYRQLGAQPGVLPLWLCISDGAGRDVLLLPLISRRAAGLRRVEMADLGITDYNAALCNASFKFDPSQRQALRRVVRQALLGHDLLALGKMLDTPGNAALHALMPAQPCDFFGNHVQLGDDWDGWRYSLEKTVRKELERSWRVFQKYPDARFVRATNRGEANSLFQALETLQSARMQHAGAAYQLDKPAYRAFYQDRLQSGLETGEVILTALVSAQDVVAVLYGIHHQGRYVMLRICHAGDTWKPCSPGKLLIERTMHHLHQQGCRYFDFAIGDYFHKRVFQVRPTPLWDGRLALSWRGWVALQGWRAKRALKRQPWCVRWLEKRRR